MSDFSIRPAHYAISVADLDASIAWYEEMLGFRLVSKSYAGPPHSMIASIERDGFQIELFLHDDTQPMPEFFRDPDAHPRQQGPQHIAFYVNDLDALLEHLTARGVKILVGPGMMGETKFCYIADNSGIPLELMQAP